MKYKVTLKGKVYEVEVEQGSAMLLNEYEIKAPAAPAAQTSAPVPAAPAAAAPSPKAQVQVSGTVVKAPLPGNILSIAVTPGQIIKSGEVLAVIEAMKMENEVLAPSDGTVKEIAVSKGQVVATGDILLVI